MSTKAQIKAVRKYERENTKRVTIVLHNDRDADIIGYLNSQTSKQGAIKRLLRDGIQRESFGNTK